MIPRGACVAAGGVVTAGLALVAPAPAEAQAPPARTSPSPRWRFQASVTGSWYENAYFTTADDSPTWSTGGRASLAYSTRLRRGSFTLGAFGGVLYYPDVEDFTQPTYGGNLGLSWEPSPRTGIGFDQTYQRSNTREFDPRPDEDVPLPTSALDSANTTFSLSQGLSRRFKLGLGATFARRRYDDPRLTDGDDLAASAELRHGLGEKSSVYVGYGYGLSWYGDETQRVHQALLGARRELGKDLDFDVAGGVAYVESVGRLYPAGHAGMTATGRRTTLGIRYSRDFGQAFGYGRQTIADVVTGSLAFTPHRRLGLDAGCSAGNRRDPADTGYEIRSLVAYGGFAWTIARELGFSARYSWEWNDTEGLDVVDGSRVTASLSYGASWR